jgi:hypothetical protein
MLYTIKKRFQTLTYPQFATLMLSLFIIISVVFFVLFRNAFYADASEIRRLDYALIVTLTEQYPEDAMLLELVRKACESSDIDHDEAEEILRYTRQNLGVYSYSEVSAFDWRYPKDCKK